MLNSGMGAVEEALARYSAGEISGEIALMRLALALRGRDIAGTLRRIAAASPEEGRLADLLRFAAANREHLESLAPVLASGLAESGGGIGAIRDRFDRAVAIAPEASVALYSLGSAEILDRATAEIAARLKSWGLLGRDRQVLDIGCGIGRIEEALAGEIGMIVGADISAGMLAAARGRCRAHANAFFVRTDGHDLAAFAGRSFDLVVAVDAFPYLLAADPAIAAAHIADAARLLRPSGALAIFNYSYGGDLLADRAEVARHAAEHGFHLARAGTREFALWDGVTFLLRREAKSGICGIRAGGKTTARRRRG